MSIDHKVPVAVISAQIIRYGTNSYKYMSPSGNWLALMWGWWPHGHSPEWRWSKIPEDKVPDDVKKIAKRGE
jgi:hypothetical protein